MEEVSAWLFPGTIAAHHGFRMSSDDSGFFDLATPDPESPDSTVDPDDQLPGRPMEGKIEISRFFEQLQFFVTEEQQKDVVNGGTIYDHLKANNLPVLGPNVGEYLYQNQHLIPAELRYTVVLVFWGKVYRDVDGELDVQCLVWSGLRWVWDRYWIDRVDWDARDQAVTLAR